MGYSTVKISLPSFIPFSVHWLLLNFFTQFRNAHSTHFYDFFMFILSITIVIIANVVYHSAQKSVAANAHPLVATLVAYVVAILLCVAAFPFMPLQNSISEELKRINWSSYMLGASIVGVELGYLLAYRAGWDVSIGSVVANVAIAVMLIPVGVLMFKESLSWTTIAGIALCLMGVALIAKK